MASKQSKIEIRLSARDELSPALRKAKSEINAFAGSVSGATAPFRSLLSSALSLKTALAGIVTGVGVTALAKSLITAGQEMDRLRLAYTSISGSGQNAAKEMKFVSDTATKLGLDLQTAANAYKGIAAAAQGTTLAGKQTQEIFTAISKASTVLGLSSEETSGALLAISQMISKGKVSAEELRVQLGERLPGAFQIAAQAMGVTTAELDKMLQDGQVFSEQFLPRFATALEQRFGAASVQAANTFGASANRISSEFFKIESAVGQAVTNNTFFVEAMNRVSVGLNTMSGDASKNSATWRQWAKDSSLAVLDFATATVRASNDVYSALNGVTWAAKNSAAYFYDLRKAWYEGGAAGAKLKDVLGITTGESQRLAQAAGEAAQKSDQLRKSSEDNFSAFEQGSKKLESAATALQRFRESLANVKSDEVNPLENIAKQAEIEFKQVGGKWIAVEKQIQESNQRTTKDVNSNWKSVWSDFEKIGLMAAHTVNEALDKAARDREVTLKVREVQAHATGGLIQRLASGGSVRNILSGGALSGYGGGDRRLLLGEDGEFMIRKEAVKNYGVGLFHALNNLRLPEIPRFAMGGPVAAGPVFGTVNFNIGGEIVTGRTDRETYRALQRVAGNLQRRSSR